MAQKNRKIPKEFTFKYVIPDHINDCYVNGAFGGVTPRNEISMHLFCERHPIPNLVTHKVKSDGTLSDEMLTTKGGNAVRIIQSSAVMNVETAVAIRNWLNDRIKHIETLEKKGESKQKKLIKG